MLIPILLLTLLVLVAGYFWQSGKNAKPKSQKTSNKAANNKSNRPTHRCVVIEPGLISCKAIRAYQGKHILVGDAPTLPVQGCDAKQCECRFLRYDDRRRGSRRSKLKTADQIVSESNNNKRSRKDRRNA